MRLILVRHGQTDANLRKVISGSTDSLLSEEGKRQAERVGLRLSTEKIDAAFSSDLTRAVETAKSMISHHPHLSLQIDARLRERDCGVLEGQPYGSQQRNARILGIPYNEFRPENGESELDVRARAVDFFKGLLTSENSDKTILLVSHGGVITNLFMHLSGAPEESFRQLHPENTAVTMLDVDEKGSHEVRLMNCTTHLD